MYVAPTSELLLTWRRAPHRVRPQPPEPDRPGGFLFHRHAHRAPAAAWPSRQASREHHQWTPKPTTQPPRTLTVQPGRASPCPV